MATPHASTMIALVLSLLLLGTYLTEARSPKPKPKPKPKIPKTPIKGLCMLKCGIKGIVCMRKCKKAKVVDALNVVEDAEEGVGSLHCAFKCKHTAKKCMLKCIVLPVEGPVGGTVESSEEISEWTTSPLEEISDLTNSVLGEISDWAASPLGGNLLLDSPYEKEEVDEA